MAAAEFKILAINPGSTSTKFGLFTNNRVEGVWTLRHSDEELATFKGRPVLDQLDYRRALIERELNIRGVERASIDAVVGRGGLLRPLASGTYQVTPAMLDELAGAGRGEHASNLGAFLAQAIALPIGVDAFIVDPVSVNERSEKARLSGAALLDRDGFCHALNSKAIAKRYAREQRRPYSELRLIIAHLGGGFCFTAHEGGQMIDATDAREEGPFSAERAGSVPVFQLVSLCFSGDFTRQEIERLLVGDGGLYSYLGTRDLAEVEQRIVEGDPKAELVFEAMAYQIAKEIGAMAAVLRGHVDAVLLTGGMAHSTKLVEAVTESVRWIAPVSTYPGEDELQALSEGTLRVLRGEEVAQDFGKMGLSN